MGISSHARNSPERDKVRTNGNSGHLSITRVTTFVVGGSHFPSFQVVLAPTVHVCTIEGVRSGSLTSLSPLRTAHTPGNDVSRAIQRRLRSPKTRSASTHLCGLAHFLADDFPFVVLVIFNGLQQGRLLPRPVSPNGCFTRGSRGEANENADLVFRKLRIVHVL